MSPYLDERFITIRIKRGIKLHLEKLQAIMKRKLSLKENPTLSEVIARLITAYGETSVEDLVELFQALEIQMQYVPSIKHERAHHLLDLILDSDIDFFKKSVKNLLELSAYGVATQTPGITDQKLRAGMKATIKAYLLTYQKDLISEQDDDDDENNNHGRDSLVKHR